MKLGDRCIADSADCACLWIIACVNGVVDNQVVGKSPCGLRERVVGRYCRAVWIRVRTVFQCIGGRS